MIEMILEHRKIENEEKVVFETIKANNQQTLNFHLTDEACFVHIKHGKHIAITPSEVIEVPEGNLSFSVGENLILKTFPDENDLYQVTIIHIGRRSILEAFAQNFPEIESSENVEFSRDIMTGKPCIVTQNYIEGILHYFDNTHVITNEIVMIKVKEILLLLLRSKKAMQVAKLLEDFVNRNTSSFKNTIENHLYSEITLEELAHLCNMSLSTFKRHFKKIYGRAPQEFIFDRRLEESKKLLATSELSIVDIALNSGFKTIGHYSRKFKEKYGIPPSQYKLTLSDK
ncbi:MAG: helix-turn-helix transcriptional regulator [Cyclobacteriaceae bacterium]